MKRKRKNEIHLVKVEEIKTARVEIEVDEKVFSAMAEAGRIHIRGDKLACFSYALNQALVELANRTK